MTVRVWLPRLLRLAFFVRADQAMALDAGSGLHLAGRGDLESLLDRRLGLHLGHFALLRLRPLPEIAGARGRACPFQARARETRGGCSLGTGRVQAVCISGISGGVRADQVQAGLRLPSPRAIRRPRTSQDSLPTYRSPQCRSQVYLATAKAHFDCPRGETDEYAVICLHSCFQFLPAIERRKNLSKHHNPNIDTSPVSSDDCVRNQSVPRVAPPPAAAE